MPDAPPFEIRFSDAARARAVVAPPDEDGAVVVDRLGLPPARVVVSLSGSTAEGTCGPDLAEAYVGGVGRTIVEEGWTAVTGGTDAGIFTLLGQAADGPGAGPTAPWVGVAPLPLVRWPGGPPRDEPGAYPLERHHSHFVLVDAAEWGDEVPLQLSIAAAFQARGAPGVAVLAGGGAISRRDVLGHVRAGRPVLVLAGSGRLADDLARAARGATDEELAREGRVAVCDIADGPSAVRAALVELVASATR